MFCSSCGSCMEIEFKYCPSCGKENKAVAPKAAASSPSNNNNENIVETSANRPTTFKAFMAIKHEERSSHIKPAKKQRLLDKQELTTNIGLIQKCWLQNGFSGCIKETTKLRQNLRAWTAIQTRVSRWPISSNHPWVCPYVFSVERYKSNPAIHPWIGNP